MIVLDFPTTIIILAIVLVIILFVKFSKFLVWYIGAFFEFFIAIGEKISEKVAGKKTNKKTENKKSIFSYYSDYHM